MYKLLLLLLLLPLVYLAPHPAEAAACVYDPALTDDTVVIGGTTVSVEIDPVTKPNIGTALYNSTAVTVCIQEDDVGNVDIFWLDLDGNILQTDLNVDTNTDVTLSVANMNGYVGPIQMRIDPDAGGSDSTDFFFFVAPPPPIAVSCVDGPDNTCMSYDPLPSYALGGQVYNQFFNTRLQILYDAAVALPKHAYFKNPTYESYEREEPVTVLGIYADDVTYATDEYTDGEWVLMYWWLTSVFYEPIAGEDHFPEWTVTFVNNVLGTTGDAMDMNALVDGQDRAFVPDNDYYGYIVVVTDRAVVDFTGTWFDQLDVSAVGDADNFIGVWRPLHSGTYGNSSLTIPSALNGGYLQLVAEPADRMLILNVLDLASATGLLWSEDNLISGQVTFFPGTNSGAVNYVAVLEDDTGQKLQSLYTANCDGVTIVEVSFAFLRPTLLESGKILVREEADSRYPAVLVNMQHSSLKRDLITPSLDLGLARYLASPQVANSEVRQTILDFAASWGLGQGVGNVVVALVGIGILSLATLTFIRIIPVGIFVAFLGLLFFTLIGILPPTWFLIMMFAIVVGIGWKLFGATA